MQIMNKSKSIVLAFKEMQKLERNTIPSSIFIAIITAVMPFVNIWFTSRIIDLLNYNAEVHTIILNIGLALIINLILFFMNNYIGDIQFVHKTLMYNNELKNYIKLNIQNSKIMISKN